MVNNFLNPSELRQNLDVLGAQIEEPSPDPDVVMKVLQNVAMIASDKNKPLPDDVFAPGISNELMRMALSSMCLGVYNIFRARGVKGGK